VSKSLFAAFAAFGNFKARFAKIKELDLASLGTQTAFIFTLRSTKNLLQKSAKSTLKRILTQVLVRSRYKLIFKQKNI
jgi:hypothetical protein